MLDVGRTRQRHGLLRAVERTSMNKNWIVALAVAALLVGGFVLSCATTEPSAPALPAVVVHEGVPPQVD